MMKKYFIFHIFLQEDEEYILDQIYDDVNEIYDDILGESNEKLVANLPPNNLDSAILDYEHNGNIIKYKRRKN